MSQLGLSRWRWEGNWGGWGRLGGVGGVFADDPTLVKATSSASPPRGDGSLRCRRAPLPLCTKAPVCPRRPEERFKSGERTLPEETAEGGEVVVVVVRGGWGGGRISSVSLC